MDPLFYKPKNNKILTKTTHSRFSCLLYHPIFTPANLAYEITRTFRENKGRKEGRRKESIGATKDPRWSVTAHYTIFFLRARVTKNAFGLNAFSTQNTHRWLHRVCTFVHYNRWGGRKTKLGSATKVGWPLNHSVKLREITILLNKFQKMVLNLLNEFLKLVYPKTKLVRVISSKRCSDTKFVIKN